MKVSRVEKHINGLLFFFFLRFIDKRDNVYMKL